VLVATPIGNADDITLRALRCLKEADAIACEDTRRSGRLLARHGIATPLLSYHEHNAARMRPRILSRLRRGETVALISDAGTPLVSDPGYKLVRACIDEGVPVTVAPGPSAALAALSISGLPSDRFYFHGFLPPRAAARRTALSGLAAIDATLVLFETARRLPATLIEAAAQLGPRRAAVAREITKRFEEVRRGSLEALAEEYRKAGPPKGEVVIVIGPPEKGAANDERAETAVLDEKLRAALAGRSLKDAVAEVAAATGAPRRRVYARALAVRQALEAGPKEAR
jgi:16S rRNA (cytidine1402-2'-O)-methyltransferase